MSELYSAANDLAIILKKPDATLLECLQCSQTFSNRMDLMEHAESHNQPQKYQCKICYKYLATQSSMKNHNRIHRQRKNICEKCGKGFYILGRLKSHMEIIHGEELRHFCPQCPKAFAVLRSLESHIKNAHGKKEYNCTICDKWFLKKYALAEHLSIVHSSARSFHCEICDKMYATKRAIRYHISKSHSERTYPCPYCGKVLATPSSLSVHVKNIHQKTREQCNKCQKYHANQMMDVCPHTTQLEVCRFHCQICDLKFRTRNELKSHNFVVHKEKQHLCDECGQVFDTDAELESHTAVHSIEKRFICDICGKKYRGQTSLKRHRLNHFEKQFQCSLCDRKFTREYLLRLHMPIHTNEKNIQCTFCPMFFRSRASLKQHEFIKHKTKARFTCKVCAKTFNILRAFKQHQKKHEKRYECDICKKQIEMKNKLQEHVEMHMNLNEGPDDYVLSCAECSRKFESAEKMKQHMSTHLNARPFRCNVCDKSFSTAGNLQSHSKYHVKKQAHLCEQCGYTCLFEEVLENHILKYHSGANEIQKTVEGFFPQDAQEDEVTERFSCEECDRQFESLQLLKLHKKTHLYECATCKQNLRTEKKLSAHIKKEHRTKTLRKCSYCDKSFSKKIHLMRHEKLHKVDRRKSKIKRDRRKTTSENPIKTKEKRDQRKTGEKPTEKVETEGATVVAHKKYHPCKKCDLMFGSLIRLRMHMKTYHADAVRVTKREKSKTAKVDQSVAIQETVGESESMEEVKSGKKNDKKSQSDESASTSGQIQDEKVLIQCQRCDQDFIKEETFITHMRSHDLKVKTLHRCQECERTFDQAQTLIEHKNRHQDKSIVLTFYCPLCDMIFKTQKGMKIHLMKIHKHWKCQYCSQVLSTDHFQTHLLTHATGSPTVSKMDIEEMNKTVLESNVESEESYLRRQKLRVLHHCPYCDFSFTMFKYFSAHLGKIHQFFKCRPCDLIIPLDKVEQHMGSEAHKADKTFKCTDCGLEFTNFNKLYYHRRRKHMFKCPECVMMYLPTLESYKDHLKSHGIKFEKKKRMTDQTANYTCAECGKSFQTKKGLGTHLRDMLKPKPRWQKVIFRCDPVCAKCKFCSKTFRNITSHLQDGVCPEKRKQEWEKNFNEMKVAIKIAVFKAEQSRKLELEARRLRRQRMKEQSNSVVGGSIGYDITKGKCKKIVCRYCPNIFYHADGYEYHLKFRCVGGKNAKRPISGVGLRECRVLITQISLSEILRHTGKRIPSLLDGKRRRRPPKCFCCKGGVCKNVVNIYKEQKSQMEKPDEFERNRQDELNEEDVLQALDIKVEAEYVSDHTYFNSSLLIRECGAQIRSYTENEFDYQRKLESTMESIKEQFETFNTMTENNYNYYNKTWPKAGMEFCSLEAAKKPLQEQTWSYICYQRPVQMIDITDNAGKCHDKQFTWSIKCNSISPPPCVDEAIKVFQDFFDSWKVLVDPFLSKQELVNFRKEIITIDIEADSSKNLSILITLCNENTSIEKAFGYYFSCANVPNIKCIMYKNIETDQDGKTAFKTTLIFGNKPTDKIICGIKINMEEFDFVKQLGGLQVISQTIENYLQSDLNFTLLEFGCKNGFLSASLSDKYEKVIGFDIASEIATGRRLCYYNNITNVTHVEASSTSIMSVIESVTNEQLHAIVNIDTPWITNLHIMRMLRSLNHLKSIVLITTFSPKVYLPILELITADPSFFGYSFIPIRSCVIPKTEDKSQFQIVMLLLREDVYERKPIKVEPVDVSSLVETTIGENANK